MCGQLPMASNKRALWSDHWHRELSLTRVREQIWSVLLGKGQVKRSVWTRLAGLLLTTNPVSHLYLCFHSVLLFIHRVVQCSSFYSPFISHCNSHTPSFSFHFFVSHFLSPSPHPPCPSHPFILLILHYSSLSFICNMYPFVQVCSWLCTSLSLSLCTWWALNQNFSVRKAFRTQSNKTVYSFGSFLRLSFFQLVMLVQQKLHT